MGSHLFHTHTEIETGEGDGDRNGEWGRSRVTETPYLEKAFLFVDNASDNTFL